MRHFCTLFNSVYQFHARLLYESICENENVERLQFYYFCFDQESHAYFRTLALKNVHLVSVAELERFFPELQKVKDSRSVAEYFFTSTPAVCRYVMENFPAADEVVYLDADLFFFQSPERVFAEIGSASISIIPHRFNALNYYKNVFGFYNVGWISFKNDKEGTACLNEWYRNTIDWCFDKLTWRRYADQKYLNYWKANFQSVCVIKNKGANVAPWNVGNYTVSLRGKDVYIDDVTLIFYHFASLKYIDGSYYTTISSYLSFVRRSVQDHIYRPYILRLLELGYVPRKSVRLNQNPVVGAARKLIRRLYGDMVNVEFKQV